MKKEYYRIIENDSGLSFDFSKIKWSQCGTVFDSLDDIKEMSIYLSSDISIECVDEYNNHRYFISG